MKDELMTRKALLILTIGLGLYFTTPARAQIKIVEEAPAEASMGVIVHADHRLDVLMKKYRNVQHGIIRSGKGFRVQIYNGNDRNKATQTKVDFMRRFPGIRTYMTYVQPQFRVKVGDYRTRQDAQEMYKQVSTLYNPCMIVPDIIVINTLQHD
jgi:hypothetical protein